MDQYPGDLIRVLVLRSEELVHMEAALWDRTVAGLEEVAHDKSVKYNM